MKTNKGSVSARRRRGGFTLIELLVVVAIIGILAAVVLELLGTAQSKGNDAAVQSNLTNAVQQGEIFYNTNTANPNSYTNVCASSGSYGAANVYPQVLAAAKANGYSSVSVDPSIPPPTGSLTAVVCNDDASDNGATWAAQVPLRSMSGVWCVDNTGKSKQESTPLHNYQTACN
jgi:prepilin-type N-terminal cleavage/methylation domain-containing protein